MTEKKILAIDNDSTVLELLKRIVELKGFTLFGASGGAEGIEIARKEKPVLIILDLMMPEMSGFEVLKALRDDPCCAETPVIILSVQSDAQSKKESAKLGANAYITKPFKPNQLVETIKTYLGGL